jgi:hypothetical protein
MGPAATGTLIAEVCHVFVEASQVSGYAVPATTALTPITALPPLCLGFPLASYSCGWKSTFARREIVQAVAFALK